MIHRDRNNPENLTFSGHLAVVARLSSAMSLLVRARRTAAGAGPIFVGDFEAFTIVEALETYLKEQLRIADKEWGVVTTDPASTVGTLPGDESYTPRTTFSQPV